MGAVSEMNDRTRFLIFINILVSSIATSMLSTALTTALAPIAAELEKNRLPVFHDRFFLP